MSFRSLLAFAADENNSTNNNNPADSAQAIQVADSSTSNGKATQEKVNINTATAKEIMKVKIAGKSMGSAKAKAIVAYRKKNGNFSSFDDLKKVKGFKNISDDNMK